MDEWGGFPLAGLTFDDSADSAGASAMSFDNTYETMDLRQYEVVCAAYAEPGYVENLNSSVIGNYVTPGL